jgi:16S rRNA processing protein RimM
MEIDKAFKIGYVMKTHGLKGEVTIALQQDCPDLNGVNTLYLERKGQLVPYFVQSVSFKTDKAFIKLEDVDSIDDAQELKGSSIYLQKSARPKLARGEFYPDEVIGFEVSDEQRVLGVVKEVVEAGPSRFLSVDVDNKETLIPVTGPFIKSVNKTSKKIKVELPDGFLDI